MAKSSWTLFAVFLYSQSLYAQSLVVMREPVPTLIVPTTQMERQYVSLTYELGDVGSSEMIAQALNYGIGNPKKAFLEKLIQQNAKVLFSADEGDLKVIVYAPMSTLASAISHTLRFVSSADDELNKFADFHETALARKAWEHKSMAAKLKLIAHHYISKGSAEFSPPALSYNRTQVSKALKKVDRGHPRIIATTGPMAEASVKGLVTRTFSVKKSTPSERKPKTEALPTVWGKAILLPTSGRDAHILYATKIKADSFSSLALLDMLVYPLAKGPGSLLVNVLRQQKGLIYGLGATVRSDLGAITFETHGNAENLDQILGELRKIVGSFKPSVPQVKIAHAKRQLEMDKKGEFPPNTVEALRFQALGLQNIKNLTVRDMYLPLPSREQIDNMVKTNFSAPSSLVFVAANPIIAKGILEKSGFKKEDIITITNTRR